MNSQLCDDFYWREFAGALRAMVGPAAVMAAIAGAALTLPTTPPLGTPSAQVR